ncbi:MAG: hypothetical protein R3C11_16150 [Planctomycetaceae bacterium]
MPEIRDRYQFLFYLYPSGQPFWETTADLRDSLQELHQTFATEDQDNQLDQMVAVGHSTGVPWSPGCQLTQWRSYLEQSE